ncbi:MAG TPA: hypothetical protein VNN10_09425 [Dehalococcoidia bacterium]|nr:hypothetical protein [Dehalococcoidia bacterium]
MRTPGRATPRAGRGAALDRAQLEALLEAAFGPAPRNPDDLRIEVDLLDRQAAALAEIANRRRRRFGPDEVELIFDAVGEFAGYEVAEMAGVDLSDPEATVPALTASRLRALIAGAASAQGASLEDLLATVSEGIAAERARLEAALAAFGRDREAGQEGNAGGSA